MNSASAQAAAEATVVTSTRPGRKIWPTIVTRSAHSKSRRGTPGRPSRAGPTGQVPRPVRALIPLITRDRRRLRCQTMSPNKELFDCQRAGLVADSQRGRITISRGRKPLYTEESAPLIPIQGQRTRQSGELGSRCRLSGR